MVLGCLEDRRTIFRRDFDLEHGESFNTQWMTGWDRDEKAGRPGQMPYQNHRLAEKALWRVGASERNTVGAEIVALALAGDCLYVATSSGKIQIHSIADGEKLAERELESPLWDGIAVAGGRLFLSTRSGKLICLGDGVSGK